MSRRSTAKLKFRPNLFYDVIFKNTIIEEHQFAQLKKYVINCLDSADDNSEKPCGIIYCKDRETVDHVANRLTEQGNWGLTKPHHGGIKNRKQVQDDWLAGVFPVITATTSFGGGIQKASIRFVVHWDVPRSVAKYYRESGLAGRDGQLAYCRIYYCKSDAMSIESSLNEDIANATDEEITQAMRAHDDFLKICNLCESMTCRHKMFSDQATHCNDRCDVCTTPDDVKVALGIFNKLANALPTGPAAPLTKLNIDTLAINSPKFANAMKLEHRPPRNVSPANTIIKEEGTDSDAILRDRSESFRPPRNISPANTIVKDEGTDSDSPENGSSDLSDELFGMQTRPPGNVSPATTIVKEELDPPNGMKSDGNSASDSSAVDWNSPRFAPPRCISPAETIIDEKPILNAFSFANASTPRVIKNEPKSPAQSPIDGSKTIRQTTPTTATSKSVTSTTSSQNGTNSSPSVSSDVTAIKREPSTEPKKFSQESRRSLSPTGTIIKDECLSPLTDTDDITEPGYDNTAEVSSQSLQQSTSASATIVRKRTRSSSSEGGVNLNRNSAKLSNSSIDKRRDSSRNTAERHKRSSSRRHSRSRSREPVKRETERRQELNKKNSSSRRHSLSRSRSYERRHQKKKSSRSDERLKRETDDDRRHKHYQRRSSSSRSNEQCHQKKSSSRQRSRSRSRSNERFKHYADDDWRHEPSSSSKYRTGTPKSDGNSRRPDNRRRNSNESKPDGTGLISNQPSTTASQSKKVDWSATIRFSVSPPEKRNATKIKDDSESNVGYGWEDPAPPKLERKPAPMLEDPSVSEKMKIFNSKLQNEYDLDVIEASRKDLYRAIEESIALESNRKLSELNAKIQKKKDDYIRELYGTDNFDHWDDDPALSNVAFTAKLKPFKSRVPDDIALVDKMSMKHVINVMKLTPARDRNELVFHGHIKDIESEFQGQALPQYLLESLKAEKKTIAGLVKTHLMPYYCTGRIEPQQLFDRVARKICHIFYSRFADANIIRKFIDDLFTKVGKVTPSTDLQCLDIL